MVFPRALFLTTLIAAPPAYYLHSTLHRLEATYPSLPPATTSTPALRTPTYPITHRTPAVDVYSARIPLRALQLQHAPDGRKLSSEEAWAKAFLESPVLRAHGRLLGGAVFFGRGGPGDRGEHGFYPRQKLLNGVFEVVRAPGEAARSSSSLFSRSGGGAPPAPLLVRWSFAPQVVGAVHYAAEWGYPWRFMSGGRHEWSVGAVDARDGTVEVRFGSAHDYEWVGEEGKAQKSIPEWTGRLHRAYARWLLDERVRALRKAAAEAEARGE